MTDLKAKMLSQIIAGMLLALVLAVLGLIMGMYIGGNFGCLPMIDRLFGTRGYESCGAFGGVLGLAVGAFLGAYLYGLLPIKNYRRMIWILLSILLLPILLLIVSVLLSSSYSGSMGSFFWDLLKILSIPLAFAILATGIFNRKSFIK